MKNNKGFIAISLIYSFFLVFLVTLLMIMNSYVHNRVLLNSVKKDTQQYLESLKGFSDSTLQNRPYASREKVTIFGETFRVIEDKGTRLVLILDRSLKNDVRNNEIMPFVNNLRAPLKTYVRDEVDGDKVSMCLNRNTHGSYSGISLCSKTMYYRWEYSIVKYILNSWINQRTEKYKEMRENIIGGVNGVRIPEADEYDYIDASYRDEIWYMTQVGRNEIDVGNDIVRTYGEKRTIHPVIEVSKPT